MECWCHGTFGYLSNTIILFIIINRNANQIWDLFEGKHMFYANDPDGKGYPTRAHLAEVIGMLGPPPSDMLERGKRSREFFAEDGN